MIQTDVLTVFLNLQRILLDNEDNSNLVNELFTHIISQLASVGINYPFITAYFFDESKALKKSCFVDINSKVCQSDFANTILEFGQLTNENSQFYADFLAGKIVLTEKIDQVLNIANFNFKSINTLIISPLITNKNLSALVLFADTKIRSQVSTDELELVKLITNLVGIAYKLQDNQLSLTNTTQQIYKMNAQLHQLDKLKNDFISVASHELRTPMTAIRSYVWMAIYRSDVPISEKLKKYLYRTLISTERLINLVNDMLNISRIESGKIEITPAKFDILALVDDVIIEVTPKAREKDLKIEVLKSQVPEVFADVDKVRQVILNLLGNSLKFTPISGKITISFFSDGQTVSTSVKDSGVGISKDDLQRLFKKFGRLDNSYVAAATSGGTGLGLYISKSLIDLMGGKIKGESEGQGKGSTFSFSLPAAVPSVLSNADKYTKKVPGEAKLLEPVAI